MNILKRFSIKTQGFSDIINITENVQNIILNYAPENNGIVNIFSPGATGAITTIEYEKGLLSDLKTYLEKIFPYNGNYKHHLAWNDDNGASHLRASLIGPSLIVPFENKKLLLGTWQQIVFIDFDTTPRNRNIIVTIIV